MPLGCRYMREQRVPREVRRRVKRYYSEIWLEQQVGAEMLVRPRCSGM